MQGSSLNANYSSGEKVGPFGTAVKQFTMPCIAADEWKEIAKRGKLHATS